MKYYKLNENKKALPCTLMEWAEQLEEMTKAHTKHVADDYISGKRISTVWLGLNHQYFNGPPLIFETMVFDPEGSGHDIYC